MSETRKPCKPCDAAKRTYRFYELPPRGFTGQPCFACSYCDHVEPHDGYEGWPPSSPVFQK